jgi:hypothetical protein
LRVLRRTGPRLGPPGLRDARVRFDCGQRRAVNRDEYVEMKAGAWHLIGPRTVGVKRICYCDGGRHMLVNPVDREGHKVFPSAVSIEDVKPSAGAYRCPRRQPKGRGKQRSRSVEEILSVKRGQGAPAFVSPACVAMGPATASAAPPIAHRPRRFMFTSLRRNQSVWPVSPNPDLTVLDGGAL